jgi:hypothetical protein
LNRKLKAVLLAAAVGGLFGSQAAKADNINLYGWWGGYRWDASMTLGAGLVNYHDNSVLGSTQSFGPFGAGGFDVVDNTTSTSFQGWCVDVFHDFYFNSSTSQGSAVLNTATSVFGSTIATDLGRLATEAYSTVGTPTGSPTAAQDDYSAAFQLAVWEIVNENAPGGYDLTTGNFMAAAGGNAVAIAQGWLSNLPTVSHYNVDIWSIQDNGASGWGPQDVAVFSPAPEPETYALMLAGLGLMGLVARRRKSIA